jgi:hypothetical protein
VSYQLAILLDSILGGGPGALFSSFGSLSAPSSPPHLGVPRSLLHRFSICGPHSPLHTSSSPYVFQSLRIVILRKSFAAGKQGVEWWVGTVRFCVQKGLISVQNDPVSRIIRHHPVSAQTNQCTSFASGLCPQPWRAGNTNGGRLERGGGSERLVRFCVQKGLISVQNDPVSRIIRHHPVSAQTNQCTSFASGLCPQPWRAGNTNGGRLERGGGSERFVSVCRRG